MSKRTSGRKAPKAKESHNARARTTVPLLTDGRGMGGLNAQDGFDYQVWDALLRLPFWIVRQSFEGMAFEALEDFEARFFAPHAPREHFLDRFQAKIGELSEAEITAVFESFHQFARRHSEVSRLQTLVTSALPARLRWLERDPKRLRNARPFYDPFPQVMADSDEKVRSDLVKQFGGELGAFVADSVEVFSRPAPTDRDTAAVWLAGEMTKAFPHLDIAPKRMGAAFDALTTLAASDRGKLIPRGTLIATIEGSIGSSLNLPTALHLHIRSDHTTSESDAVEIDASPFSGGGLSIAPPAKWQISLVAPLLASARWAYRSSYRRVEISGQYRLSPAFVVGWAFRSAIGFELNIPTKDGIWNTDAHPAAGVASDGWEIVEPKAVSGDRLRVAIGVVRDPLPATKGFLNVTDSSSILVLQSAAGVASAVDAQGLAQAAKTTILEVANRCCVRAIDLFFVGPAALAVALGHRWNAMPRTQLYEYDSSTHRYQPSAELTV